MLSSLQYCKYCYFAGISTNKNSKKRKTKTLRYNIKYLSPILKSVNMSVKFNKNYVPFNNNTIKLFTDQYN